MVADKEITSWDIVREPNRILSEEIYSRNSPGAVDLFPHLGGGTGALFRLCHFLSARLTAGKFRPPSRSGP